MKRGESPSTSETEKGEVMALCVEDDKPEPVLIPDLRGGSSASDWAGEVEARFTERGRYANILTFRKSLHQPKNGV